MTSLNPIQVEEALAISKPTPDAKCGPVESQIRAALELFGPDGENWIKGSARTVLEEARVENHPIYEDPIPVTFDFSKIPLMTMRYEQRFIPPRFGYCSVGSLMRSAELHDEHAKIPELVKVVFVAAVHMRFFDDIVRINDLPGTTFDHVKKIFEHAIDYAHERGL